MINVKDTDLLDFDEEDFDTVLAPDIDFSGTIMFSEPFMIKGIVTGSIKATSDLLIDENALVKADISARQVVIKGKVEGNVSAEQLVHVLASGSLTGDITAPEVVLESGCFFSGACSMNKPKG
ncbi:MAG: polymer-forming cytoskeletal protein [Spirochaetaceae bacterium]|jgi:cytoskeletal protein CcmA (bactofilin family)|nr:polymer-forming cytoskeletal protein [Spirochaetaceae bacterium]